jgi:hypothetical protein
MKFVYPALSNTLAEEELSSDFVETVPVFSLVEHYYLDSYQPHFSHIFLLPSYLGINPGSPNFQPKLGSSHQKFASFCLVSHPTYV